MNDAQEIRLRLIEAAARFPAVHQDGPAAGVLAVAREWLAFVTPAGEDSSVPPGRPILQVPKK